MREYRLGEDGEMKHKLRSSSGMLLRAGSHPRPPFRLSALFMCRLRSTCSSCSKLCCGGDRGGSATRPSAGVLACSLQSSSELLHHLLQRRELSHREAPPRPLLQKHFQRALWPRAPFPSLLLAKETSPGYMEAENAATSLFRWKTKKSNVLF